MQSVPTSTVYKTNEADMNEKMTVRDALVMGNARKLIKANKRTTNASLYMHLFGTGMTTAVRCCKDLGLDPDSNVTDFTSMMNKLASGRG